VDWLRLDRNITGIEGAEVLLCHHGAAVFRPLEIDVDEFMHGAAMQKAQHLAHGERGGGGGGADERRADGLAGEQGDAAAIERTGREHALVGRAVLDRLVGLSAPPDLRRRAGCGQGVEADRAEVAMSPA
jgi:hypothetical protein